MISSTLVNDGSILHLQQHQQEQHLNLLHNQPLRCYHHHHDQIHFRRRGLCRPPCQPQTRSSSTTSGSVRIDNNNNNIGNVDNNSSDTIIDHDQRISFLQQYRLFDPWKHPSSSSLINPLLVDPNKTKKNNDDDDEYDGNNVSSHSEEQHQPPPPPPSILSRDELELQNSLLEYRSEIDRLILSTSSESNNNNDDNNNTHLDFDGLAPTINRLQQSYMELLYWEEALELEQCKCDLYYTNNHNNNKDNNTTNTNTDIEDEYADSIHTQGKLYLRQENFQQSKQLYDWALQYFSTAAAASAADSAADSADSGEDQRRKQRLQQQHGHVLISLAGWHFFRQELHETMELLEQSEPLVETNPALLVKCLDNQGLVYRLWSDYSSSLDKYQQALQVVTGGVDPLTERALQLHIADMYVALERPDEALDVYQGLLSELERHSVNNNNNRSSEFFQQSSSSYGNDDNHDDNAGDDSIDLGMKGVLLHNIATIHVDQGQYDLALDEFHQALVAKQSSASGQYNSEVGKTCSSLGALYAGVFDDKIKALEMFQQALLIARIHADKDGDGDGQSDPDVLIALQNISMIEQALQNDNDGDNKNA